MKVALLCPGPSLPLFEGRAAQYDQVLAVNRAVLAFPADFWVMLDAEAFRLAREVMQRPSWPPERLPVLVSWGDQHVERCSRYPEARQLPFVPVEYSWLPHEWQPDGAEHPTPLLWDSFSGTAALVLARRQGAVEIDAYGVDWSGLVDWDGKADPNSTRGEERWAREQSLWQDLTTLFARDGIRVRRIGHDA
jgi:hypothetical protein